MNANCYIIIVSEAWTATSLDAMVLQVSSQQLFKMVTVTQDGGQDR